MFGRGGITNRLYWRRSIRSTPAAATRRVSGTTCRARGDPEITGAAVYQRSTVDRRIFLFVRTHDHKLQFITFDLDRAPGPIRSISRCQPATRARSTSRSIKHLFYDYQPRIAIRVGSDFYFRPMNAEGTTGRTTTGANKLKNANLNLTGVTQLFAVTNGQMWIREGGQMNGPHLHSDGQHVVHVREQGRGLHRRVLWARQDAFNSWMVERRKDSICPVGGLLHGRGAQDLPISSRSTACT